MKKTIISIFISLTIFAGLGTTAFAEGTSHKSIVVHTSINKHKNNSIKATNFTYIKPELLNGSTVPTINLTPGTNFKNNIEKDASKEKFKKNADDLLERYNEHLKDVETLDDIVKNPAIKKSLKDRRSINHSIDDL